MKNKEQENQGGHSSVTPLHDWDESDVHVEVGDEGGTEICADEIFQATEREYIPLQDLPSGAVLQTDDAWKASFSRDSVFPPIVVERGQEGVRILHGNHRVIMWRAWGFKYAPAFIAFSKQESI